MELRVNDLLKINTVNDLIGDFKNAPWVDKSVKRAPFVVVRRAPLINGRAPVGIRGRNRSQRLAAEVLYSNITEIIRPEKLSYEKLWRTNSHMSGTEMLKTLEAVDSIFNSYNIIWGPTGSVGFGLVSGIETITETSDLDIIVRAPKIIPINIAKDIKKELLTMPVKIDVQLETPKGSIALTEYARADRNILLRTINGPRLVENPWADNEELEG